LDINEINEKNKMTTTALPRRNPAHKTADAIAQFMGILMGGIILFITAASLMLIGYNAWYLGRIFPGVRIAGVDVSGLTRAQAEVKLNQVVQYPLSGKLLLRNEQDSWIVAPAQMGMLFDPAATAENAFRMGRMGTISNRLSNQLYAFQSGMDVAPVVILDERTAYRFLQSLAAQVDIHPVEGSLSIEGMNVIASPGQMGRLMNVDKTLEAVSAQMQTFKDGEVLLAMDDRAPEVLDVSQPAEAARHILETPLNILMPNPQLGEPGPWQIDPSTLASMLIVEKVKREDGISEYKISASDQMIRPFVLGIARELDKQPKNARFIFNDSTRQLDVLEPAIIGRSVRVEETISAINNAINNGQQTVTLSVDTTEPAVKSDATAASLGITENVITYSSYFRGSSTPRIQNIKTAAASFHGLLIAPGEVFSMGQALGDVSLDNGYAEAMIIYGNQTIKGVGGGVCQVSTTLFRSVFMAGFPIVERAAHAYRVSYYEQTENGINPNLAGLDATVYFPLVDLKFVNDTPYWLLMETYVNEGARRITWKLYSTKDGRTVDWETTGPFNRVPAPDPVFQENPELEPGVVKQTDWSAEGADVQVVRRVSRGGQLINQDYFNTYYAPWQAVCEYGPGTEDPKRQAEDKGLCQ
jgi:vancomycin resistance protein YoaR